MLSGNTCRSRPPQSTVSGWGQEQRGGQARGVGCELSPRWGKAASSMPGAGDQGSNRTSSRGLGHWEQKVGGGSPGPAPCHHRDKSIPMGEGAAGSLLSPPYHSQPRLCLLARNVDQGSLMETRRSPPEAAAVAATAPHLLATLPQACPPRGSGKLVHLLPRPGEGGQMLDWVARAGQPVLLHLPRPPTTLVLLA